MYKMIALYKQPSAADLTPFEEHYFSTHVPLVNKVPGLVKAEVNRFTGAMGGDAPYYLMAELYFNSKEEMDQAMGTPEGRAMAKDTRNFPPGLLTVAFAEVVDHQ